MGAGSRMHAAADLRAAPEQVDHAESIAGVSSSWFGREEGELGTHTFVTFGRRNASSRRPPHRDRLVESVRLVPFSPNTDLPFSPFRGGTGRWELGQLRSYEVTRHCADWAGAT